MNLNGDHNGNRQVSLTVLAGTLLIAIFVLDLVIPAGILVPILYAIPILIAIRFLPQQEVIVVAALSALFTVLGLLLSPAGGPTWLVLANRTLAVGTIAGMAVVYAMHRETTHRLSALEQLLPQCASCKKVRDDVGYWSQLELYLEEHRIQQFTQGLCPECEFRYKEELLALKAARADEASRADVKPYTAV